MHLRVVSWNVDSRPTGLLDAKVELLRQIQPDLAVLQEISRSVYRALLPHPLAHERMHRKPRVFSWGTLSTDLCQPRGDEHRLGCAVLGVAGTALLTSQVLDRAPFEVSEPVRQGFLWRTVAARVALANGTQLTACSFQARRSSSPSSALRRAFHAGIAGWLAGVPGPVIFGIDAGVPSGGPREDPLLGPGADHNLADVLDRYLDQHPEELKLIRAERPDGPLAISRYVAKEPVRHDHLWATPDLAVLDVQYRYDEGVAAGSDHALIVTDFEI